MTKTFKLGAIFFITILWQIGIRILFNYLSLSANATNWVFSLLIQLLGMGLLPFILYKLWIGNDVIEGFYLTKRLHPATYVIAVVMGFLFYYGTIGVSTISRSILELLGFTRITTSVGTIYSGWEVLLMEIITVAILPGFFEEFTNRGLLMRIFEHEKNHNKVILIMALMFALFHQNIMQTVYTFVGGLVLAYMAVKTRNIWPSIIVHFVNNLLSVLMEYSSQKNGVIYAGYSALMNAVTQNAFILFASWIITGLVIAWLLRLIARLNKKNLEEPQPEFKDSFESIYGLYEIEKKPAPAAYKAKLWEYGLVIAAAVMACSVTIFTFIWGTLR
ncbi:MAG: type II CAAX endopeptidase family protein [Bacillota bacterium]|jgi:membrane protease YdiL (CAAX protease family)|nr:type II CAAX endopeptidase family protein [Bacillota bacterium]HHU43418.1 CPBP family intramembrane metalloprotease [Clostridiales bacterium]